MDLDLSNLTREQLLQTISSQQQTIKALSSSHKNLQLKMQEAQQMANLGLWEYDIANNKVLWSEQVYKIFNITPDTEITYEIVRDKIHPDDRDYHDRLTEKRIQGQNCEPYNYRILSTNDQVKFIRGYCITENDSAGKPIKLLGAVQDITAMIELQGRLKKALEEVIDGFIPICSYCKSVRDPETNDWTSIEGFILNKGSAQLSHSICPACFPEVRKKMTSSESDD